MGESGPKRYSYQLWLDWHQIDIGPVERKISWLTSSIKNYGYGENASGRLKSANSSSSNLSKKEWQIRNFASAPVICVRYQTCWYWTSSRRGIRPKALQLSVMIRLTGNANLFVQMTVNVPNLVQMRLISYRSKMETFMLVAEFQYACSTHTYIFYLLRQDSAQLKKLKADVDLPN